MAGRRSSSSRPSSPRPGDWERCSIPHSELVTLQTKGFLPPAYMIPVRAGLAVYNGGEQAESAPNPSKEEWVCLVPDLISTPNNGHLPRVKRMQKAGAFLHSHP